MWVIEYQEDLLKKIRSDLELRMLVLNIRRFCDSIQINNNIHALGLLLLILNGDNIINDSFTKLLISEQINNSVKSLKCDSIDEQFTLNEAKAYAYHLAEDIIKNEVSIDQSYKEVGYLEKVLNVDNILKRANAVLTGLSEHK